MESMRTVLLATNRFRTLVCSHTEKRQYNTPMTVDRMTQLNVRS